jgi:hypothetical protein
MFQPFQLPDQVKTSLIKPNPQEIKSSVTAVPTAVDIRYPDEYNPHL